MKNLIKHGLSAVIGACVGAAVTYVAMKIAKPIDFGGMLDDEFEDDDCECCSGYGCGNGGCHDSYFDNEKSSKKSNVEPSSMTDDSFTGATINIVDDAEEAVEAKEAVELSEVKQKELL